MSRFATAVALMICGVVADAWSAGRPMAMDRTHYEIGPGEPIELAAPGETVAFLLKAKTRRVKANGAEASGIVVAPSTSGDRVLLATSLRTKPGEYAVELSATSDSGDLRTATLTVTVGPHQTVPSNATRPPVVLLNGWETGYTGVCPVSSNSAATFGNLGQYLASDGVPVVYFFDNCVEDPGQPIEVLGNDLSLFLNSIQFDNGAPVTQIDLVAHSMGGLIVRSYLAGLQLNTTLTPPANTLVRKLVLIATPNFGSFVAANFASGIPTGTQSAEVIPGSSFLYNLATWNQRGDDLRGVDAIAVVGNAGAYVPSAGAITSFPNASDGLVSLTSAAAGFASVGSPPTRIVPFCHVDPAAFINPNLGTMNCVAPGIANVTSTSHSTGQIVRSFLAGTTNWMSIGGSPSADPYLSKDGGMFFGLANSVAQFFVDLSQVVWGTLQLQTGGDGNTIFFNDLVFGTGQFVATSHSAGNVNCGSFSEPAGFFTVVRCKMATLIQSIGPLASGPGKVVNGGSNITISGSNFATQCNGCQVLAIPAGSSTGPSLSVSSWTNQSITAALPSTLSGLLTIVVKAAPGSDSMNIMVASATSLSATPSTLQFAYMTGGTAPAAQPIQIAASGGALSFTATSSASWLSVTPASGTTPASLSVSVAPAGMSPGNYTGNIQITAAGASNSPISVAVTLTVTAVPPTLGVSPQALTYNYTFGGAHPAAQTLSIVNAGSGSLSWTASASAFWIGLSATTGNAPATLSVSVNPANLAAGTYTSSVQIAAAGALGSPVSVAVTLVVQGTQPAGNITAAVNAGSYQTGFASATFVTIFGTNLSQSTQTWQVQDFVNGILPTSLDGVSVTINGMPAYVEYISPTQLNVLAPDDPVVGAVQVQVTAAQQASNNLTAQKQQFAPAWFTIDNGVYVAAAHANGTLVGKANLFAGVTTQPAQPGETLQVYGGGFGPTNPALPTANLVTTAAALANSVQITIGGVTAPVVFAGLVESGLYQFNVTVPSLPNGDAPIVATINGVQTQSGVSLTIQQ